MKYKVFDPKTNKFLEGSEDRFFLISSGVLLASDYITEEQHNVIEQLMGDSLGPQYHLIDSTNFIAENYEIRPFSGFKDVDGKELYVGDYIVPYMGYGYEKYKIEYIFGTSVIYVYGNYKPLFEYSNISLLDKMIRGEERCGVSPMIERDKVLYSDGRYKSNKEFEREMKTRYYNEFYNDNHDPSAIPFRKVNNG